MGDGSLARCARQSDAGEQDGQLTLGLFRSGLQRFSINAGFSLGNGLAYAQKRRDDGAAAATQNAEAKGLLPGWKR